MEQQQVKRNYQVYMVLGIMCFAISTVLPGGESTGGSTRWIALILTVAGIGFIGTGFLVMKRQGHVIFDERYILNRLKATRFALILGMIAILGFLVHSQMTQRIIRWDLVTILAVIAAGKIGAMIYYTHTR